MKSLFFSQLVSKYIESFISYSITNMVRINVILLLAVIPLYFLMIWPGLLAHLLLGAVQLCYLIMLLSCYNTFTNKVKNLLIIYILLILVIVAFMTIDIETGYGVLILGSLPLAGYFIYILTQVKTLHYDNK